MLRDRGLGRVGQPELAEADARAHRGARVRRDRREEAVDHHAGDVVLREVGAERRAHERRALLRERDRRALELRIGEELLLGVARREGERDESVLVDLLAGLDEALDHAGMGQPERAREYFEQAATGSAPTGCKACSTDMDCGSTLPHCNYGFCEAQ